MNYNEKILDIVISKLNQLATAYYVGEPKPKIYFDGEVAFYNADWLKKQGTIDITPFALTLENTESKNEGVKITVNQYGVGFLCKESLRDDFTAIFNSFYEAMRDYQEEYDGNNYRFKANGNQSGVAFSEGSGRAELRFEHIINFQVVISSGTTSGKDFSVSYRGSNLSFKSFKITHGVARFNMNAVADNSDTINSNFNNTTIIVETYVEKNGSPIADNGIKKWNFYNGDPDDADAYLYVPYDGETTTLEKQIELFLNRTVADDVGFILKVDFDNTTQSGNDYICFIVVENGISLDQMNKQGTLLIKVGTTNLINETCYLEGYEMGVEYSDITTAYLYFVVKPTSDLLTAIKIDNLSLPILDYSISTKVMTSPISTPNSNQARSIYTGKARAYMFNVPKTSDTTYTSIINKLFDSLMLDEADITKHFFSVEFDFGTGKIYTKQLVLETMVDNGGNKGMWQLTFIDGELI